jgi:sorbitol-specific phosphotransferase system component IIC
LNIISLLAFGLLASNLQINSRSIFIISTREVRDLKANDLVHSQACLAPGVGYFRGNSFLKSMAVQKALTASLKPCGRCEEDVMKKCLDKELGRISLSDTHQRRLVRIVRIAIVSIFLLVFCWRPDSALASNPDSGWLATAQKKIDQKEYEASRNNKGLQAPNRAHNIRTYFSEKGIRVVDRTASGSPGLLGLTLNGFGRGKSADDLVVGKATLYRQGNRVELRREKLTEWFINNSQGLEHGFEIARKPPGEGNLRLTLRVDGSTAAVKPDGVIFKTSTGRVLKYDKLKAIDAGGKVLPSRFQMAPNNMIAILVDDGAADYPLTIDPLLTSTADAMVESDQASANLGVSVSGAGDVNGDGYADVIVGAYFYDNGQNNEGAFFVYHGSAAGINTVADTMVESDQADAWMGWSVSGAGDVNGDGYADVIVGAYGYGNPVPADNEGAFFVYHGTASGINTVADTMVESNLASAVLGFSVSGAGDVNGDGYGDVVVGARFYDNGQINEGAAFVYHGSAAGINTTADAMVESDQTNAYLGHSVSGAGDINGDGYADVIVGAHGYGNPVPANYEGAFFVYHGSASGISTTADAMVESNQANAQLGWSLSGAGDVNGDGYADVIVGAYNYDNGQNDEGAAFVYHGSAAGLNTVAAAMVEPDQINARLGQSVSGAGDVNGDGYADVIVGAYFYDSGQNDEGAAFVYYGNSEGRTVMARQLRGNGGTETVAPWGGSYDPDGFQVRIQATSPKGRKQAKMQIEYCPCGVPFEDPSCDTHTSSDWTAVSGSGAVLTETIAGLNLGERYRWRARLLYAPFTVTQAGITDPPNPAHGPWRRLNAQSDEADILIDGTPAASGNSGGGGCFIATASYRSQMEPQANVLCEVRDGSLLTNSSGKVAAEFYFFLALISAGLVILYRKLHRRGFKA